MRTLKLVIDEKIPIIPAVLASHCTIQAMPDHAITQDNLKDADIVLVRTTTSVTRSLLDNTPVQFVGTASAGFDHIDIAFCKEKSIHWAYAPGNNAQAVADYVHACVALTPQKPKTAAVIGVGQVGSKVVKMLEKLGILVWKNDPPRAQKEMDFIQTPLEKCLTADLICIHTPLIKSGPFCTQHLINAKAIANLASHTLLIQASRGGVVEESGLLARSDLLLCLDVFENEPRVDPALLAKAWIATPHIAGYSRLAKIRASLQLLHALKNHFHWDILIPDLKNYYQPVHPTDTLDLMKITADFRKQGFKKTRDQYILRAESTEYSD